MHHISFFRPDIAETEINEVVDTLRSGWITTGKKTKLFEKQLDGLVFSGSEGGGLICLSSATAAEELNLRILGVRPGDEVLVPALTYTATASAAVHCGATVRFVDIRKDGDETTHAPEMDYDLLADMITEKTKAIISVDYGGLLCDYRRIQEIVSCKRHLFRPVKDDQSRLGAMNHRIQSSLGRIAVVSDSAHALGSVRKQGDQWYSSAELADFASYSFHAVKNLTTAEGGAAAWRQIDGIEQQELYHLYHLLSLHGQSKDAADKEDDSWEYDVIGPWYKYNMTDIVASVGLGQLGRYPSMLKRRREIVKRYDELCDNMGLFHLNHVGENYISNCHLYPIRIPGISEEERNELIHRMYGMGIQTNVHYKPLPMMSAYKTMSGGVERYPNSYEYYKNLITLPLYSLLTDDEVTRICDGVRTVLS